MALELIFVRHGQSEGNRDRVFVGHGGSRLTRLGELQAEATARALADLRADRLVSSDLPRCTDTAAPLARSLGVPLELDAAIRERDVGAFTGLRFDEVRERYPAGWEALVARDPDFRPEGGESHRDCRARVGAFLDRLRSGLAREEPAGNAASARVVLVSHGVAINHMLRHLLGLDGEARATFQIGNCALHRLTVAREHVHVLSLNDAAHLAGLAER